MSYTPISNRPRIVLIGRTNSGKSSLVNAISGQRMSIVSEVSGTTTDAVVKAMELLDVGPVVLVDTAGLDDNSPLGELRMQRTTKELTGADVVLLVNDAAVLDRDFLKSKESFLKQREIPFITLLNKCDVLSPDQLKRLAGEFPEALLVAAHEQSSVERIMHRLSSILQLKPERGLLDDIPFPTVTLLLVIPLDSEAPQGRLILPQVQLLRAALERNLITTVVRDSELKKVLTSSAHFDLVVCDSQVFSLVNQHVNGRFPLTSFSILFARQKGNFADFLEGTRHIANLKDGDKVLIAETCTHTTSHEDIGKKKIPFLLQQKLGLSLDIYFAQGMDFPQNLSTFALVIHCGGCMLTRKQMLHRMEVAKAYHVPITNYGMTLAFLTGTLGGAALSEFP